MFSEQYIRQVKLLLQCLPAIRDQRYFCLKGGTALNLFIHDLPRLSVDIDLTYQHFTDRETSLSEIQTGLRKIATHIQKINPQFIIKEQISQQNNYLLKLLVYHQNTMIKIEPNFIARGTLYPIVEGTLCKKINQQFDAFLDKVPLMVTWELYAGKLCAALNRQHPRDLFDIKLLLENGGIIDAIRQAFVIYLASDVRPLHELLSPNRITIEQLFHREFSRMTAVDVTLEQLLDVREKMISFLNNSLTINERLFLLSVKQGEPQFDLMPFQHLDQWPSLKWKVMNINRMDKKKRQLMLDKLKATLKM
ncbi:MAG: nucleotidyl transferase AbiEii/AbiGii toxin family protein [Coxiellaceae bacterium]|nr:MAG: nucleotidyl transferase AbiEii/AbiGii toxin family protein [Coxiellaceae bacterium]